MKNIIILVLLCGLLFISVPVMAETPGIHGEVSFNYELAPWYPGQEWFIDLHYNFVSWLSVGMSQTTFTSGARSLYGIPGFMPKNQLYKVYLAVNFNESTSLRLSQWCNHPVFGADALIDEIVPYGICLSGSYKF